MKQSHAADAVATREELGAHILSLRHDFERRGAEWQNVTLDQYLEALAAWINSAPNWYRNFGHELPAEGDWRFMARALSAAVVYE